ncbi:MAG: glycosyltransferase, partial [Gammaproteobacteria bacterium]
AEIGDRIGASLRPRCLVLPAFLPPAAEEIDKTKLPGEVRRFVEEEGSILVLTAFRIIPWRKGGDVYGIALALEALAELRAREHAKVRLLVYVAEPPKTRGQRELYEGIQGQVRRLRLEGHVMFRFRESALPILDFPVVLVRPTRTDGDAVSIREALSVGVPVVASDVVHRPPGCTVFSDGEAPSLAEAISACNGRPGAQPAMSLSGQALLDLYREALRPTPRSYGRQMP